MPIKNYKGAGKGRVRRDRGFFFFLLLPSVLTQQCLSDRAAVWHDGIYFVSSLIHSDKALLWISMKDTRGQIHEAQTNSDCPVSLLVFWYSDPAWTECHVCHRGGREKKKKAYFVLWKRIATQTLDDEDFDNALLVFAHQWMNFPLVLGCLHKWNVLSLV